MIQLIRVKLYVFIFGNIKFAVKYLIYINNTIIFLNFKKKK